MIAYFTNFIIEVKKDARKVVRAVFLALGKLIFKEVATKDETFVVFSNDAVLNQKIMNSVAVNPAPVVKASVAKVAKKTKVKNKKK
ncbi:MAG: hypothetical protein WC069_06810 [Candidatus Shapirobacteria bacterium]